MAEAVSAETYGEAGTRERVEFWGVLVLWWLFILAVLLALPRDSGGGLAVGVLLGLGALAFAPITLLFRWQRNRQSARLLNALTQSGFTTSATPTLQQRRDVLQWLGPLALLRNDPDDVSWIAHGGDDDRPVTVLHHTHLDGAGRYWYDRTSTVVALPTEDLRPGVWLTRTNVATARRDEDAGYAQDLEVGDAWFDRNFRILSHDPDSLARILTPAVRRFIATGPCKESWTIGYGYVVCVFGADTTPHGIGVMIRRVRALAALVQQGALR